VATETWIGSTSTDWFTASNWDTSSVPASGDDVVIPTTATAPHLSKGTTVDSVTISGTTSLSLSSSPVTTLIATNGITLSSTGGVTGNGTLLLGSGATLTATGAATIAASGGQLAIDGPIDDAGNQLTLAIIGNTDTLSVSDSDSTAETVNFNGASGRVLVNGVTLTIGTTTTIGKGRLDVESGTFINASGVMISTGTISGIGTIDSDVTATGAARIATGQFGGSLEITGPINDSGSALTLTISNDSGILQLDSASTAHAVSFNGTSGLLQFFDTSLTVGTQLAVGSGQIFLGGTGLAELTDASGVTINTGTIGGAGTLAAAVTATDDATIYGNGLTLEITGTITDSGAALTLSTDLGTLLLDNTSAADAVSFSRHGTVELRGALTVGTAMTMGGGVAKLDDDTSSLTDLAGISLGGGLIIGSGTVAGTLSGTGTVRASGGLLELVTPIGASTGTAFQIANAPTDFLAADGTVDTGNTFTFLGANGALLLGDDSGFDSTVAGLNVGADGAETNFVDIEGHTVTVSDVTGQGTTDGTITLSDGAVLLLSDISSPDWIVNTVTDSAVGTEVFLSEAPCFLRGTLILTERGDVPVEELQAGMLALTYGRAEPATPRPVVWVGHRSIDCRRHPRPNLVWPVRVAAGAFGNGLPRRDLWLSPDHAVYFNGVLIPVKYLINDVTIVQMPVAEATYFHVQLGQHEVLLAEGLPVESYLESGDRATFENGGAALTLHPDFATHTWEAHACAPLVVAGPALAAARAMLNGLVTRGCGPNHASKSTEHAA
jgi:collagen type I alpha